MLIRGACANEVINDEVLVSALFLRRDYPSLGKCNQCNKKGRGTIKVYRYWDFKKFRFWFSGPEFRALKSRGLLISVMS